MKKSFDDIVSSEKRSIRNIPLPRRQEVTAIERKSEHVGYRNVNRTREQVSNELDEELVVPKKIHRKYSSQKTGKGVWAIALLSIIAVFISTTWVLSKTTVFVDVKKVTIDTDMTYEASEDVESAGLVFDTVELSFNATKEVEATGTKELISKASGTVVLFNNFSSAPQALVVGTRLESPEGLIFRLSNPVTIPGKKIVSGKNVPGSVEAKVVADGTGEKYNLGLTDFTIPGFKGGPKFNAFYGRSKTTFSGGAIGTIAVVQDEILSNTRNALRNELNEQINKKITSEIPKDYIFIDGAHVSSFKSYDPENKPDSKALIKEELQVKAFIFKKANLIKTLASSKNVEVIEGTDMTLDSSNIKVVSVKEMEGKVSVAFEGKLRGEYVLDESNLKKGLLNKPKDEVPKILSAFPVIDKAQVIIKPFWVSKASKSEEKIEIIKNGL